MQLFVISFFFKLLQFLFVEEKWRFCLLQMVFRGQGYFSYIVAISFIGGGNRRSTRGFELTTLVVIGTDCIGSCDSNYHTITTTTAPKMVYKKQELLTSGFRWGSFTPPFQFSVVGIFLCLSRSFSVFGICCLCLWIVHSLFPVRFSLTFIYYKIIKCHLSILHIMHD